MSNFKAKMQLNLISAGALPQTPLGSLQRSPHRLSGFKGLLLRGGEGKGEEGNGREESGAREWEGKRWKGRQKSVVESKNP